MFLIPLDILIWCLFCYVSLNTQKVKIVIIKQVHINLCFIEPKIEIFCDFWVFIWRSISKNENLEITEIHQKPQNTEIWECNFKKSWNIVQLTSISKWFSHHVNNVPYFCISRDCYPSRFVKLSLFICAQKVGIVIEKPVHMHLNFKF